MMTVGEASPEGKLGFERGDGEATGLAWLFFFILFQVAGLTSKARLGKPERQ